MKLFKSLAVSLAALVFATTAQAKEVTLLMDWFPQGNQSVFWQAMLDNDEHDFSLGFQSFENLQLANNDRYQYILPYYSFNKDIFEDFDKGSISFNSTGSNDLN